MNKALRILLPIFLSLVILLSLFWYFFIYDRALSRDLLLTGARISNDAGNSTLSAWFYNQAYKISDTSGDAVVLELAEQYRKAGNYTKAEYTLTNAITNGGGIDVYIALCQVFVEQNKLYDAVSLLDSAENPEIKEALDKRRPSAPLNTIKPGLYQQYISVGFEAESGTIYTALGDNYPSLKNKPYSEPIPLSDGENYVSALAISKDGLVSPLVTYKYTIGGVVEQLTFSDQYIEATVRDILKIEKKPLYTNNLWKITEFTVPAGATSYQDLKDMKELQSFTVDNGVPGELTCLSYMPELVTLSIQNTEITDEVLAIIGSLKNLKSLTLQNCKLGNIAALKDLENIEYLDLSNNSIYDPSPLSGMRKLTEVYLQNNVIDDLSSLENLNTIVKLDVSNNKLIKSIKPLSNLTKLEWLNADSNEISELGEIGNLKSLQYLSLRDNKLTGIAAISGCSALINLNFSKNQVSDISSLSALTQLMYLYFEENQVTTLPDFDKDCALVIINGTSNNIQSLEPLGGLKDLNSVYMNSNPELSSVTPLASCYRLIEVHVDKTRVTDVSALEKDIIVKYTPITS